MAHYLDTSAIIKLVVAEPESAALRTWLAGPDRRATSSDLARAELIRAARRQDEQLVSAARNVLEALEIQTVHRGTFESAGVLNPIPLRTLDAIHLACALNLGDDLESIVTYDERLAQAARDNGIAVSAPS